MSGAAVSILLPRPLSRSVAEMIAQTIARIGESSAPGHDLHVLSTRSIGGNFAARRPRDSRPFGISASALTDDEIEAAPAVTRHFGIQHQAQIDVVAFCNSPVDHQILGEIALHFAEQTAQSVISFGGDLSAFHRVGGDLVSIPYETTWGTTAVASYGDVTFLRAWLRNPSFFMIR